MGEWVLVSVWYPVQNIPFPERKESWRRDDISFLPDVVSSVIIGWRWRSIGLVSIFWCAITNWCWDYDSSWLPDRKPLKFYIIIHVAVARSQTVTFFHKISAAHHRRGYPISWIKFQAYCESGFQSSCHYILFMYTRIWLALHSLSVEWQLFSVSIWIASNDWAVFFSLFILFAPFRLLTSTADREGPHLSIQLWTG